MAWTMACRCDGLRAVLARIPKRATTILTSSKRRPWTVEGFGSSFNKAKIDAGMSERDLHFNDLRGTAATKFYIAGAGDRRDLGVGGVQRREDHSPVRLALGRDQGADQKAGEQRVNKPCKTACKTVRSIPAKCWSGRSAPTRIFWSIFLSESKYLHFSATFVLDVLLDVSLDTSSPTTWRVCHTQNRFPLLWKSVKYWR